MKSAKERLETLLDKYSQESTDESHLITRLAASNLHWIRRTRLMRSKSRALRDHYRKLEAAFDVLNREYIKLLDTAKELHNASQRINAKADTILEGAIKEGDFFSGKGSV